MIVSKGIEQEKTNEKLKRLYIEIANLTLNDCKKKCSNLGSCCDESYCNTAILVAKEYDLVLTPTGNRIPLLDSNGSCIAPPYVRQMCSAHSCDIFAVGYFKGDSKGTAKYFELREAIDDLEIERLENREKIALCK
jgi:hypothetical protein